MSSRVAPLLPPTHLTLIQLPTEPYLLKPMALMSLPLHMNALKRSFNLKRLNLFGNDIVRLVMCECGE